MAVQALIEWERLELTMTSMTLDWIDPKNKAQLTWIAGYLKRTQADNILNGMHSYPTEGPFAGKALIAAIEANLGSAEFRERFRKMKEAWRQQKSRQKKGKKAMTHQLPTSVLKELDGLAKTRKQSKVQVLSDIISDAAREQSHVPEHVRKGKEALTKMQNIYQQKEAVHVQLVDSLMKALTEELHQRCRLEAQLGGPDDSLLEGDTLNDYHARIDKRVSALEPTLTDMKRLHISTTTLRQRMQTLADGSGLLPQDGNS